MATAEKEQDETLYASRRAHFNAILDAHECGAGDWTVKFTASPPTREEAIRTLPIDRLRTQGARENLAKIGRWAVVTHGSRGHGHFVTNVIDKAELEQVAAEDLSDGWVPICYYDLDRLAGDEPPPEEGDKVDAGRGTVTVTEEDSKDGIPTVGLSDGTFAFVGDVRIVERETSVDARLPARYDVAKVVAVVAFNTLPSEPLAS
jgi:hypothetical protein